MGAVPLLMPVLVAQERGARSGAGLTHEAGLLLEGQAILPGRLARRVEVLTERFPRPVGGMLAAPSPEKLG